MTEPQDKLPEIVALTDCQQELTHALAQLATMTAERDEAKEHDENKWQIIKDMAGKGVELQRQLSEALAAKEAAEKACDTEERLVGTLEQDLAYQIYEKQMAWDGLQANNDLVGQVAALTLKVAELEKTSKELKDVAFRTRLWLCWKSYRSMSQPQ